METPRLEEFLRRVRFHHPDASMFVHLEEIVATRVVSAPLRISSHGLQWPA